MDTEPNFNKDLLSAYTSRPSVRRDAVTIRTAAKYHKVVHYSLIAKNSHLDDDLAPLQKLSSSYFVSFTVRTSLVAWDFHLCLYSCLLVEVRRFACPAWLRFVVIRYDGQLEREVCSINSAKLGARCRMKMIYDDGTFLTGEVVQYLTSKVVCIHVNTTIAATSCCYELLPLVSNCSDQTTGNHSTNPNRR
jgi:hypothetical protein